MLLLLLGCTAPDPNPDTSLPDDVVDDSGERVDLNTLSFGEADFCQGGTTAWPEPSSNGVSGASPFGTGRQNGSLGAIEDPDAIVVSAQPGAVDRSLDLDTEEYELYIPPNYDGSEPYGLLVHIDAGNGGDVRNSWIEVLDEQKVIWVGPRQAGNSVNVDIRIGKGLLGAHRALELFNIDTNRVYGTGTSGGGRSGTMMTLLHPQLFTGAMPVCGSAWYREVEQAYETQEPDSHYEFWDAWFFPDVEGQPYGEWLAPFDQRFALLTSYDDFREGDLQNIYHHGMRPDGYSARLIEGEGGHCATDATQARDGLAWLDSPGFEVDVSDALVGDGVLLARQRTQWNSGAGTVVNATLTEGSVGLWPYAADTQVADLGGQGLQVTWTEETLTLSLDDAVLFTSALDVGGPVDVELTWWAHELQLRTNAHFVDPQHETGKVFDDQRVFQLKGLEVEAWPDGAVVGLLGDGALMGVEDDSGYRCE